MCLCSVKDLVLGLAGKYKGLYYWQKGFYKVENVGSLRVVLEGWIANWMIFNFLKTWDGNLVCWERKNEFKHQAKGLKKIKYFDL